jgi:hypothetical protein
VLGPGTDHGPLAHGGLCGASGATRMAYPQRLNLHMIPPPVFARLSRRASPGEYRMFEWQDLFQWDRFITPAIIKIFYWLAIGLTLLWGLSSILSGLAMMVLNPFAGFILVIVGLVGAFAGIIFARILAEFVLIVFRINDHLGAIRDRGHM